MVQNLLLDLGLQLIQRLINPNKAAPLDDVPQRELFDALFRSPESQPGPWTNFESARDAHLILSQITLNERVRWRPCNGGAWPKYKPEDAIPSLATTVVAGQNAVLTRLVALAIARGEATPQSPQDAARMLLPAFTPGERYVESKIELHFAQLLKLTHWAPRSDDPRNGVIEIQHHGERIQGISFAAEPPRFEPWAIPSIFHGRPSFHFADITLMAMRRPGEERVLFTVVRRTLGDGDANPELSYLEIDRAIPSLKLSEAEFPVGMLTRHIGFDIPLFNGFKEKSLQGALDRSLPLTVFPIPTIHVDLFNAKGGRRPVVGSVHRLERFVAQKTAKKRSTTLTPLAPDTQEPLGPVKCTVYFCESDRLRELVHPDTPILMVVNSQTIFAASKQYLPKSDNPRLTGVIAVLDCSGLSEHDQDCIVEGRGYIRETLLTQFVAARTTLFKPAERAQSKPRGKKANHTKFILSHPGKTPDEIQRLAHDAGIELTHAQIFRARSKASRRSHNRLAAARKLKRAQKAKTNGSSESHQPWAHPVTTAD